MTAKELEFILPFPPSVNGLYFNIGKAGTQGRAKTKGYLKWQAEASHAMRQQHPAITPYQPIFINPVEVEYRFSRPNKIRRDLSNLFKATDDFMVGWGVLLDDSLIYKIAAEWTAEGNGVFIRVKEKNNV